MNIQRLVVWFNFLFGLVALPCSLYLMHVDFSSENPSLNPGILAIIWLASGLFIWDGYVTLFQKEEN